jgi:hypothetical protein
MKQQRSSFGNFLYKNHDRIFTSVVCVIIASVFWFFNALNKDYTTTLNFPLQLNYDESKYRIVDKVDTKVKLVVSGYGWNLIMYSLGFFDKPLNIELKPEDDGIIDSNDIILVARESYPNLTIIRAVKDNLKYTYTEIQ